MFIRRKDIAAPDSFDILANTDNIGSMGYFPDVDNRVDVQLWRKELGYVCVTIVLDRLIDSTSDGKGELYVMLCGSADLNVENYVNLGSVEMLSSGIRYIGSFRHRMGDVMMLEVDPCHIKDQISVFDDPYVGFMWHSMSSIDKKHFLATRSLGGDIVFNFAVCGEFNLAIFFRPSGSDTVTHIFSKGFCCK